MKKFFTYLGKITAAVVTIVGLNACVVEPAPIAYAPPPGPVYATAPTPYYYGCCYAYPEYPVPYGYYGPAVGVGFYGGGGGWHGGWHR